MIHSLSGIGGWLPDSKHFVYAERDRIYLADIVTKEKRELLQDPGLVINSPFVSRDGKLLYYTATKNESDIWLLDLSADK